MSELDALAADFLPPHHLLTTLKAVVLEIMTIPTAGTTEISLIARLVCVDLCW
jgi:hypothetical protein